MGKSQGTTQLLPEQDVYNDNTDQKPITVALYVVYTNETENSPGDFPLGCTTQDKLACAEKYPPPPTYIVHVQKVIVCK